MCEVGGGVSSSLEEHINWPFQSHDDCVPRPTVRRMEYPLDVGTYRTE